MYLFLTLFGRGKTRPLTHLHRSSQRSLIANLLDRMLFHLSFIFALLRLRARKNRIWKFLLIALISFSILGDSNAYFDDFSPGLINYTVKRFGNDANRRMQILLTSVQQMKASSGFDSGKTPPQANISSKELTSLGKVNDFYNQVPYYSDMVHWGVEDYWATPIEFVASLGGDCEDYAIAKYMTLKSIGVPLERMRITYVRAIKINEAHMVLAYYPTVDAEPWILDNLIPEIKLASARTDLVPVYSFNDDDVWLANGMNSKGGASNVRLWKDLRDKMVKEKLL